MNILLVDKNHKVYEQINKILLDHDLDDNYCLRQAVNQEKAFYYLESENIDIIIFYADPDNSSKLELLKKIKDMVFEAPVILILEQKNKEILHEAYLWDIYDYLLLPLEDIDFLLHLQNASSMVVSLNERKKAEDFLQKNIEQLSITLHSIGDGVIVTDNHGYVTLLNQQAENLTGWSFREAVDRPLDKIFRITCAQSGETLTSPVQKVLETGEIVYLSQGTTLISREGTRRIISDSASPIRSHEGALTGVVMVFSDITEQYQARSELRESEEKFRTLAENSPFAIMIYQEDQWVYANPAAEDICGYSQEELLQLNFWDIVHPEFRELIRERGRKRQAGEPAPSPYDFKIISKTGEEKWVSLSGASTIYRGKPAGFIMVIDITDRKRAEEALQESEERHREILSTMEDGYYEVNLAGVVTDCNRAAAKMMGFCPDELIGFDFKDLSTDPEDVYRKFNQVYLTGTPSHNVGLDLIRKDGSVRYGEFSITPTRDEKGNITGFRGVGRDLTERKRYEEQLKYLSFHDQLTGLYNRAYFENELKRLEQSREYPITIISADLDGLKLVNDTMGHEKGDDLLVSCAQVLKDSMRSSDILARVGGDEFAAILPRTEEKVGEKIVSRIRQHMENYNREHQQLPLNLSLGIACARQENCLLQETFKEADDAMYRDKLHKGAGARSQIINSLLTTLGERDFITEGHLRRMEELCLKTGEKIKLSQKQLADLGLLARVHDLGKVGIPDNILFKPGALTEEEWKTMSKHPEKGYRIAISSSDLAGIANLILRHHERWDGNGYPLGIKNEEIPIECRILSIVDAYDAMTSDRPYRRALSHKKALEELRRCAGSQFDPWLVEVFIEIIENEGKEKEEDKEKD